jgi:hypothetical protein
MMSFRNLYLVYTFRVALCLLVFDCSARRVSNTMLHKEVDPSRLVEFLKQEPKSIKLHKRANNLSGKKFGRLTAIRPIGRDKAGNIVWRCRCDCMEVVDVRSDSLIIGRTMSCGCSRKFCKRKISKNDYFMSDREVNVFDGNFEQEISLDDFHELADSVD